jgi:ABC-type molybdate transport system substrate-binding protein
MPLRTLVAATLCAFAMIGSPRAEQLHVLAAGTLREALAEIDPQYRTATVVDVTADFGPSGILRQWIEEDEHADLFASAGVGHPLALLEHGFAIAAVTHMECSRVWQAL